MFERLTETLNAALKSIKGNAIITEVNVSQAVKEMRKALLDADVNYQVVKELTQKIKEKSIGKKVLQSVSPGEMMVSIVKDELAELMGSSSKELQLKKKPAIIMVVGLQGSGKTTFVAKLAKFLKDTQRKKPFLIAADIHRPAAIRQLQVLGEKIDVPVFADEENKKASSIVREGIEKAKASLCDTILVDTAGRQTLDETMMREAQEISDLCQPDETLFILDAMIGQDAVNTAKAFYERLHFTGIVITKIDGDARGGAALSAAYVTGVPIKFISDGEKPEAISLFHPDRMAQRIVGMGDVLSLVEKAQMQFDKKEAELLEKKLRKAQFDFNDFKDQLQKIKNMGDIKSLIGMVPGMAQKMKNAQIDDKKFIYIESIINSMTPYERAHPDCFNESRKKRISAGSGRNIAEVNALLKQFEQMQKMMKRMSGGKIPQFPF